MWSKDGIHAFRVLGRADDRLCARVLAANLTDAVLHRLLFQDPVHHINILGNVRTQPAA